MAVQVTQAQLDEMQVILDSGDRGGAYLYYYDIVKEDHPDAARQILIQAQITTYSGFLVALL